MHLSAVQRDIVKAVVQRFLKQKEATSRKALIRQFRAPQAFHELTSTTILSTSTPNVPTVDESYLPRSLAFHYYEDSAVLEEIRSSLALVLRILQDIFDHELEGSLLTPTDIQVHAEKIFDLPPTTEAISLGLYLARDFNAFSACSMNADQTEVVSFQIAESIVEINDFEKVWDEFVARCTAHESLEPQPAISMEDLAAILRGEAPGQTAKNRLVDAVTGIFQRTELDTDLQQIADRKDTVSPVTLMMIDLDHFKNFNDKYGHPVGDEVLRSVARSISTVVKGKGTTYRYGGEEIAVILPNYSLEEGTATAERIRTAISAIQLESVHGSAITASLGVTTLPCTSEKVEELVKDADRALYEAKNGGRNQVRCATKDNKSGSTVTRDQADVEPERQGVTLDVTAIEYLKNKHPATGYSIDEVASDLDLTMPDARSLLECLKAKNVVRTINLMEVIGGVAYMLDELYRSNPQPPKPQRPNTVVVHKIETDA